MKTTLFSTLRTLVLSLVLASTGTLSAQIIIGDPEPAPNPNFGGSAWTRICAGGNGGFNQYYVTSQITGTPNNGNEFILELSDASGGFSNPVELAREGNLTTVTDTGIEFSIPTDTRGDGYKLRLRSTDPARTGSESPAFDMYYQNYTTNFNISPNGDGSTGDVCSTAAINLVVDNVPNASTYRYIWYRSSTQLSETGPSISADQSGVYQAYIDYGACTGSTSAFSNWVTVTIGSAGSGVAIATPGNTALCTNESETLQIASTDPAWSYQWYQNGNAISGATGTSYTVSANTGGFEGDYEIEISGPDICTERSAPVTITNASNFTITRNNAANIVLLPAQAETISVSTTAISPSFQWYRNGNAVSGATSASLEITQDGTYYAAVTQNGGSCSATMDSEATTAVLPDSFEVVIAHQGAYTDCVSTSTVLEVGTINADDGAGNLTDVTAALINDFNYQWRLNGADVAGATGNSISLTGTTENGTYSLSAVLDAYSDASNSLPVRLLTNETLAISSTSTVYCSSADIVTISTGSDLNGETFAWERDGVTVSTTDTDLTVTDSGTYRLIVDKDGCDLISNEISITPLDPNLIQLDIDGDVIFPEGSSRTVNASGGTAYQWFDTENNLMSSTSSMTFTEEGDFILIANIDNCEISRPITVTYLDLFNIPNVITPNGDGANDQWVIPNSYSNRSDVNVIIYDDKGTEMLNVMGYQNNWPQSSVSFQKQNMVFYYIIKNASETLKQGTVTVIR
ncbi:gliding motility-associated C-terminal domain-containing protein [Maribacter sp. 2-571]|uniref:T9SS type B sorting domain-containing protein n=1 Tax=Maribacter sp. 2-571 TaxID=3417569 RepID=UPI003D34A781